MTGSHGGPADVAPPEAGIASMTGFSRSDGTVGGFSWSWEARSVNGRSLDVRCRLPAGFERLDAAARAEIGRRIRRGNVTVQLGVSREAAAGGVRINRAFLDKMIELARELEGRGCAPPRADGLLGLRGVIETDDETDEEGRSALETAVGTGLSAALDALADARREEGARLLPLLRGQLDRMVELVTEATAHAAAQPAALKERLRASLATLLENASALSEERLAQEAAVLVGKSDVREELDRLSAHLSQAQQRLTEGGAIGRRLDFLCQEFNREANTLCAKSPDVELTRVGLELKATIEQFREQVQNIE